MINRKQKTIKRNGVLVTVIYDSHHVGDKQKDAIKGGMGRFSNMIKSAAAKGSSVLKKKVEEPAEFPEFDVGLVVNR